MTVKIRHNNINAVVMSKVLAAIKMTTKSKTPVKLYNRKGRHFATVYAKRVSKHLTMFKIIDTAGHNIKDFIMHYVNKCVSLQVLKDGYARYLSTGTLTTEWTV